MISDPTPGRPTVAPLTPVEVAAILRAAVSLLRAELAALPPAVLRWHPAPDEWCVKEIVGHLIEAEHRGFAGRIRTIRAEAEPGLSAWDPAAVARQRGDCDRDAGDLLRELSELREASATLVAGLGPADLARGGHHPTVGYLRVGDLLHEWVHHDRNHATQILSNVQAYVWPAMGNAQRFSPGRADMTGAAPPPGIPQGGTSPLQETTGARRPGGASGG